MEKSKFIIRPKIYERQKPSKDSRKIYIYCEGDRESKYFKFFEGLSSNVSIIPIPSKNGKSDPEKLLESAKADFNGDTACHSRYVLDKKQKDSIWFVIDTDQWGDKISTLRDFCKQRNPPQDAPLWFVTQSNPCFEIWLYFHYYNTKPQSKDVKQYSSMKDFVNDVIPGGFDSRKMPAKMEEAINNAKMNFNTINGEPDLYSTEVYKLGETILPFVKSAL
jgi:hypothetical protein